MIRLIDYSNLYGVFLYTYKGQRYTYSTFEKVFNMIKCAFDIVDGFVKRMPVFVILYCWFAGIHVVSILNSIAMYNCLYLLLCVCRRLVIWRNLRHQKLLYLMEQINKFFYTHSYNDIMNDPEMNHMIKKLHRYDFRMNYWPLKYRSTVTKEHKTRSYNLVENICDLIIYLFAYFIGIPLMYPGSGFIVRIITGSNFEAGRINIQHSNRIHRMLIETPTNDTLDTAFVDRRLLCDKHGQTLLIVSEGNASFYETGVFHNVVLSTNYSVLGWNQPGFGESTGNPFSTHVEASILSLMDYATKYLGFKEENIAHLGFSIGGYPSCYAASKHPNIKCLILDATFANIEQVALMIYPRLEGVIKSCMPKHFTLYNSKVLQKYPGPLKIILRLQDQIMSHKNGDGTYEHHTLALTLDILKHRYPQIFSDPLAAQLKTSIITWIHTGLETRSDGIISKYLETEAIEKFISTIEHDNNCFEEEQIRVVFDLMSRYLALENTDHNFRCSSTLMDLSTITA